MSFKLLIVNAYSSKGGATRAAKRLEACLQLCSGIVVSFVAVMDDEQFNRNSCASKFKAVLNRLPGYLLSLGRSFFSTPLVRSDRLVEFINSSDADLVNLHWVNSGSMSIDDIGRINKPILWSLHDMWPFTGGCHYSGACEGYRNSCKNGCAELPNFLGGRLANVFFEKKKVSYRKLPSITLIGLSNWIANQARASVLSNHYNVINLPNPIDVFEFSPMPKEYARKKLRLPMYKSLILFGAMSVVDKRKGFSELCRAIQCLSEMNVNIVVFGATTTDISRNFDSEIFFMGNIHNDEKLVELYSAADVMVVPSLQENLSNAIMESMACGLPVVGFDIGGNSDMIDHKVNGYLARPRDTQDLADGIRFVLSQSNTNTLSIAAREKVVSSFSYQVVSRQYMAVIQDILRS